MNALRAQDIFVVLPLAHCEESDVDPTFPFSVVGKLLFISQKLYIGFLFTLDVLGLTIICPEVQFSSLSLFITPGNAVLLLL